MADTGRTVFADGFFADGFFAVGFFAADEPVTVPDVDDPGTSQAAAISAIEAEGLVAAVVTAYSSTVPVGEVISQDPAAGSSVAPGSTVTITVSLGDQPQQEGGGGPDPGDYLYWLERAREFLRKQAEARIATREQVAKIPDETTREIAALLKKQEAKDEVRKEMASLQQFADKADISLAPTPRMAELIRTAATARTNTALLTLQREMSRIAHEEEMKVVLFILDY